LFEGAVGPAAVVVIYIVDNESFEVSLVPDDGAVEQFSSDGSDPAFSEGVGQRSSCWCAQDLEAFGSEDLVEAVGELAATITNERSRSLEAVSVAQERHCCIKRSGMVRAADPTDV
jgi:hypothetical protein